MLFLFPGLSRRARTALERPRANSPSDAASHPWVSFGMELTNVLFWFAGFVALGVFLSRLLFCRGTVCAAAQADTVFSALLFATWGSTVALVAKDVFKSGFPRRAAPAMAPPMKETMA